MGIGKRDSHFILLVSTMLNVLRYSTCVQCADNLFLILYINHDNLLLNFNEIGVHTYWLIFFHMWSSKGLNLKQLV